MYPEERAVWRLVCKQACEQVYTCTDGLRYDPYSSIYSYSCISRNKAAAEPAQYQPTMFHKCPNVKMLSCCEAKLAGFDGLPASVAGLRMQRSMSAVNWSSLTRLVGLIHLDIASCDDLDTAQLAAAMRRLPNISTLRMQGNQLSSSSSSSVQHITDALPSLTKLTKLVFDDARTSADMAALAAGLATCLDLQVLKIRPAGMWDADSTAVAQAVAALPHLTHLRLAEFNLQASGAALLARSLNPNMQRLDLGCNGIGPWGMAALAGPLAACAHLIKLDLGGNELRARGAAALTSALKLMPKLQYLNISYNHIGREGARHLAAVLPNLRQLLQLHVDRNVLGVEGMKLLLTPLAALAKMKLQHVSAGNNRLGQEGTALLRSVLEKQLERKGTSMYSCHGRTYEDWEDDEEDEYSGSGSDSDFSDIAD